MFASRLRTSTRLFPWSLILLFGLFLGWPGAGPTSGREPLAALSAAALPSGQVAARLARLPLAFVPNLGQADPRVQFAVQSQGNRLVFGAGTVRLSLSPGGAAGPKGQRLGGVPARQEAPISVELALEGANPEARIAGRARLPGVVHDFRGNDPTRWRSHIPTYAQLVYDQVYPGIGLQYDGSAGLLKGTYTIAPGADPGQIGWRYRGATDTRLDTAGDLQISLPSTGLGGGAGSGGWLGDGPTLVERAPVAWQTVDGRRIPVAAQYRLSPDGRVGFALGAYDPTRPLVIDPTLVYSTYLGGAGEDSSFSLAVDSAGAVYVAGVTRSGDFPGTGNSLSGTQDGFVAKLNAAGDAVVYRTYLGGSGSDAAYALALDGERSVYLTGEAGANFPTTAGAAQESYGGNQDAFLVKLDSSGVLAYSSYLGGSGADSGQGVAITQAGDAYLTGYTEGGFPTTPGAFDRSYNGGASDAFVAKLTPTADAGLGYSTYLGEDGGDIGYAIAVNPTTGQAYVAGQVETSSSFPNLLAARLDATGGSALYNLSLGGGGTDVGTGIVLDGAGNAYLSGRAQNGLPGSNNSYGGGVSDAFVLKLDPTGAVAFSHYLGGSREDQGNGIALDGAGNIYVTGGTRGLFPTVNPLQGYSDSGNCGSPCPDAFVVQLDPNGTNALFSTTLGGPDSDIGYAIAVDSAAGSVHVTGRTMGSFPTQAAFQSGFGGEPYDAFIVQLSFSAPGYSSTPTPGTPVDLGSTPVGVALNTTAVSASEAGTGALVASSVSVSGDAALSLVGPSSFTIADGGAPQPITVRCQSATPGSYSGTLTVGHNAAGSPASYPLSCTVTQPGFGSTPPPGVVNLGHTPVGVPTSVNIAVRETGNAALRVELKGGSLATALSGTHASDFTVTGPGFPFNIADNGPNQTITVQCMPTIAGVRSATLTLTTNDPTQAEAAYDLACTGDPLSVAGFGSTPAPGPFDLGSAIVGSSVTRSFTVDNTGTAALTVSLPGGSLATAITGPNAAEFTVTTPAFPFTIGAGDPGQSVSVRCTPGGMGLRSASLTLNTNDPTRPTAVYDLNCTGLKAGYSSSPVAPGGTIALGRSLVGQSATFDLAIAEAGNTALSVALQGGSLAAALGGAHPGDFTMTQPTAFPLIIADGAAGRTLTVQCTPTALGTRTATLTLSTNDPDRLTVAYDLSCLGTPPPVAGYSSSPAPGPLNLGNVLVGASLSANITVSETGDAPLMVDFQGGSLATALTGAHPGDFTVTAPASFPFTIADGEVSRAVSVRCMPSAPGPRSATLTLATNDPAQPTVAYALACAGIAPPTAGYGSTPAPPGPIEVGSAPVDGAVANSFSVFETGTARLDVGVPNNLPAEAITGPHAADFAITAPTSFPFSITDGGQARNITVRCIPSALGPRTATLTFTTNDPARPTVSYDLHCAGTPPPAAGYGSTPAPGPVSLGSGPVGTAITAELTVAETGNASLTVGLQGNSLANALTGTNREDFTVSAPSFPFTIADGGDAQAITVQCTPGAEGPRTATLTLTSNDPNQPTVAYDLGCIGTTAPRAGYGSTPPPGSVNAGDTQVGTPVTFSITIAETGTAALTVGLPGTTLDSAFSGSHAADFALTQPTVFPFTIPNNGASQVVTVRCIPSATGPRVARLTFTTNDPDRPTASYDLTCTGTPLPAAGYQSTPPPGPVNIGSSPFGVAIAANITVAETGDAALNVGLQNGSLQGALTGPHADDFTVTSPVTFPFTVSNGGQPRTVTVQCTPTGLGGRTATLTLTTNDPAKPTVAYNLSCTGQASPAPGYGSTPPPGPISLGSSPVGTPITTALRIQEQGTATLMVDLDGGSLATALTGAHAAEFTLSGAAFPLTFADGAPGQSVTLQCIPGGLGTRGATLTLATNDPARATVAYALTCIGLQAGYDSTPAPGSVNLGSGAIGTPRSASIVVRETGNRALTVGLQGNSLAAALTGPHRDEFSITAPATFPFTIADGGPAQTITAQCAPGGEGRRSATLTLTTNDPARPTVSYSLTCTGVTGPVAGYSSTPVPGSLGLGSSPVGMAVGLSFTVQETGNAVLTVGLQGGSLASALTGANPGDFTVTEPATFPLTIPDGGLAQTIRVQCTPSATGTRGATLTLTSNDPNHLTVAYQLSCQGTPPLAPGFGSAPAAPGPIAFGSSPVGVPVATNLAVFETGNAPLAIRLPNDSATTAFGGLYASEFSLLSSNFPLQLANGGSGQVITLQCTPGGPGERTATFTLQTNDPSHPTVTYALSCTGTQPEFSANPAPPGPVELGDSPLGTPVTTQLTIAETGNAPLTIGLSGSALATALTGADPGDFSVTPAIPFPFTIADGGPAQTLTIRCAPSAVGLRTATLTLTTNAPGQEMVSFDLTCTGVSAVAAGFGASTAPGPLTLGNSPVGVPATVRITIGETGAQPLVVGLQGGSLATALTGPQAAEFTVTASGPFPFTIADGGLAQVITIQCTPRGPGPRTASLTLTTNDPNQPTVTYSLTCTGMAGGQTPRARLPLVWR